MKFSNDNTFVEYPDFTQEIKSPDQQNGQNTDDNNSKKEENLLGTFEVKDYSKSNKGGKGKSKGKGGSSSNMKTIYIYKGSIPEDKKKGDNAIWVTEKKIIDALEKAANSNGESTQSNPKTIALQAAKKETKKSNKKESKTIGYTTTGYVNADGKHIFDTDRINNERFDRKIIIGATLETLDQSSTLQSGEAIVLPAPGKYKSSDQKTVMTAQGPKIIGIHANAKENEETQKFVNWF